MKRLLILSILILVLLSFVSFVNAQKNDLSVPMDIADEFKNDYDFEDALEWYEKVIQDFPDTIAAGNASLNKLVILSAQTLYYKQLNSGFVLLANAQHDIANEYSYGDSIWEEEMDKFNEFSEKCGKYVRLIFQKGGALREEFYRFEKKYASKLNKLSSPYINKYTGRKPPIVVMKEDDVKEILALGKESYLEYESRKEFVFHTHFILFCLRMLGSESSKEINESSYYDKEYMNHKIDPIGFYHWLGIVFQHSCQFKSAFKCFTKVIDLAKNEPYNKLAYEAEKGLKIIKERSSEIIDDLKRNLSQAVIDEYVEPYTEDSEK